MIIVDRSAIVPHSAETLYAMVADIEAYPEFLPWCTGTEIIERSGERVVATLHVSFGGIRQRFTTENRNLPGRAIVMALVSGPFLHLSGTWRFEALGENAAKVSLHLEYQLASRLLERVAGPVFGHIANTFVDAFVKRAEDVR